MGGLKHENNTLRTRWYLSTTPITIRQPIALCASAQRSIHELSSYSSSEATSSVTKANKITIVSQNPPSPLWPSFAALA